MNEISLHTGGRMGRSRGPLARTGAAAGAVPAPTVQIGAALTAAAAGAPMTFRLAGGGKAPWALLEASAALRQAHGLGDTPSMAQVLAVLHPDDRAAFMAACTHAAGAHAPWLHEYRVVREGGRIVWFCGSALPETPARAGARVRWAGFVVDISERKRQEEASRFLTARNRLLMRTATDGLHILDSDGYLVEASDNFARLLGYTAEQMAGMHVSSWHERWNHEGRWKTFQANAARSCVFEAVFRRKNGLCFPVEVFSSTAVFDGRVYISSTSHDVSGRKRDENELRVAAAAFEARQCMFITDAVRRVVKVNLAFSRQTGYAPQETMGKLPPLFASGLHPASVYAGIWRAAREDGFWSGELNNRRKDGTVYPVRVSLTAVHRADGAIASYVGTEVDISAEKEAEQRITRLAFYDALTGLPNRRLLHERLAHSIALGRRSGALGALLFIDLDHFKQLNDSAGHDVGDMLLVQLARRLVGGLRDADTVARLGGDEFVVVLENLGASADDAARMADTVCRKLAGELKAPYDLAGHLHQCTPSIGFTLFGEREESVDSLIKRADLAMYQAKAQGRNGIVFFDLEMRRAQKDKAARIAALKLAVAAGQFELHYQPQLTMTGAPFGVEALARWRHPAEGLLAPVAFIELAEETGVIVELGRQLLGLACRQLRAWSEQPLLAATNISVNVSARQFRQRDFVDEVLACVRAAGANPARLTLEITESTLVDNIDEASATMQALKAHGIGFSLDDFGVGYSSLSYLKRLPFDQLKIDRAFVTDVARDPRDAAIAATIVALGCKLGLDVVAEGVETAAQRDCLQQMGCHAWQGYLIGKAMPASDYAAFCARMAGAG